MSRLNVPLPSKNLLVLLSMILSSLDHQSMAILSLIFPTHHHPAVNAFQPQSSYVASSHHYSQFIKRNISLQAEIEDSSSSINIEISEGETQQKVDNPAKQALFQSFRKEKDASSTALFRMNAPTEERTALVCAMTETNPTPSPGSEESFASLAPGIWRVVYAPHIATFGIVASKLLSAVFTSSPLFAKNAETAATGRKSRSHRDCSLAFDPVYYLLRPDGTMTSHARLVFNFGDDSESVVWFSVAGTYSSQDNDQVCRVDFDEAWVRSSTDSSQPVRLPPYPSLELVPKSLGKNVINALGKFFFVDAVSTFPVSYLDDDCIVFDFELLGTRICAKKVLKLNEQEKTDNSFLQFLAKQER